MSLSSKRKALANSFIEVTKYPKEIVEHIFEAIYHGDKQFIKELKVKGNLLKYKQGYDNSWISKSDFNALIDKLAGDDLVEADK